VPSRHDPADSLRHIIENAARVARYLKGLDQQSFARNDRARDAVERCIERVCEASVRLGDQADELMPGSRGPTSAAWVTGYGMRTTAWTSTSFGGQRRTACLSWLPAAQRALAQLERPHG